MPAAPPQVANFIKDVVALKKRVRELELAVFRKSASTLRIKVADLINAKVFGAVNHQVFTYMDGDWTARGGATVTFNLTPVTGSSGLLVDADAVPSGWNTDQACIVSIRVSVDGDYPPVPQPGDLGGNALLGGPLYLGTGSYSVTIDGTPATLVFDSDQMTVSIPNVALNNNHPHPLLTVELVPEGGAPGEGWSTSCDLTVTKRLPLTGLFATGTPTVHVSIDNVNATVYPDDVTVSVEVAVTPLP